MLSLLLVGLALAGPTPPALAAQADALAQRGEEELSQEARLELTLRWTELVYDEEAKRAADWPGWARRLVSESARACWPGKADVHAESMAAWLAEDGAWMQANPDPEARAEALRQLEAALRLAAVEAHAASRRARDGAPPKCEVAGGEERVEALQLQPEGELAYGSAADLLYSLWLERFGATSKHAPAMRYAYGELLYDRGEVERAYAQYMAAVEAAPEGALAATCAEFAVHAAKEGLSTEAWEGEGLSPWGERFVAAVDLYAQDPAAPEHWLVSLHAASMEALGGRLTEARARTVAVVRARPEAEESQRLVDLVLDALLQAEDYAGLAALCEELLGISALDAAWRAELETLAVHAHLTEVERRLSQGGDPAEAARRLEAVYRARPEAKDAERAAARAAELYRELGDRRRARKLERAAR